MDNSEFTRLVLLAEPTLYRISKTILKNDFDCADAVQEAIIKAFASLDALKDKQFFKTWLCRILINECYRIYRFGRRAVSLEELQESEYSSSSQKPSEFENVELREALMKLKEKSRLVIVLHYIEGFKTAEIAQALKIPEGTVKSRLSKARTELRSLLNDNDDYDKEELLNEKVNELA